MKPVMSVEEARKLLGEEANKMSNDEIERLISDLDVIARYALHEARKQIERNKSQANDMEKTSSTS